MEQFHLLILLSFGMLIGSFLSGTVPMAFKLSDNKSRLLALMGSGILVGTALAIIIPEGINSIYAQPDVPVGRSAPYKNSREQLDKLIEPQEPVETWVIGISLVAGFVLMLLIDQFSIYQSGEFCDDDDDDNNNSPHRLEPIGHRHSMHADYTLANQDDDDDDADADELSHGAAKAGITDEHGFETISEAIPIRDPESHRISIRSANQSPEGRQLMKAAGTKVTPTLGLVIHAAADGVALGAAATTSHREVEMIIFLAIMLHKAPAAFSLVVFLLHRGLKHSTIRRHLMAFSLSAPLAALLTYFGLSQSGKEALRRNNATGIAMLFSAGTFLYVATVHVLPELVHNKLLTPKELIFLVGGAFLPILLAESI